LAGVAYVNDDSQDWQPRQLNDPEFVAESEKLALVHEITRLRLLRGLAQGQLAEMVGTRQPAYQPE